MSHQILIVSKQRTGSLGYLSYVIGIQAKAIISIIFVFAQNIVNFFENTQEKWLAKWNLNEILMKVFNI